MRRLIDGLNRIACGLDILICDRTLLKNISRMSEWRLRKAWEYLGGSVRSARFSKITDTTFNMST